MVSSIITLCYRLYRINFLQEYGPSSPCSPLRAPYITVTNRSRFHARRVIMESTQSPPPLTAEPNPTFRCELEKWQPSRSASSTESAASSIRIVESDHEKQEPVPPRPDVDLEAPASRRRLSTESESIHALPRWQERSVPPADGGTQAWLFLAGCFGIEAFVWGKL